MKINIIGWYGHKNSGDDAFEMFFRSKLSQHSLTFTEKPDTSADITIFGGGGVLGHQYITDFPKDRICYGIGVDMALNGDQFEKVRLLKLGGIWLRSWEYAEIAKTLGIPAVYAPDLAFGLKVPVARHPRATPTMGVILTDELQPRHEEALIQALTRFSQQYSLRFISMYEGDGVTDLAVNSRIEAALGIQGKTSLAADPTPESVMNEIANVDVVLSMRFHGLIFATMVGTPFLALSNKGKCSLYCEQEGLKDFFIELEEINPQKIALAHMQVNAHASHDLRAIAYKNQHLVDAGFEEVCKKWLNI
jgi:polysaccharide pyruvyl transferase WcaK-like protein